MRSVGVLVVSQYDFVIEEVYESWRMKLETISLIGNQNGTAIFQLINRSQSKIELQLLRRFVDSITCMLVVVVMKGRKSYGR